MGFLASFLTTTFGSFFGWLTQWFTKKTASTIALVAAVVALTSAFYATTQSLLGGIASTISDSGFLMVWWSVWPENGIACITACFAADLAGFFWRYQKRLVEIVATA